MTREEQGLPVEGTWRVVSITDAIGEVVVTRQEDGAAEPYEAVASVDGFRGRGYAGLARLAVFRALADAGAQFLTVEIVPPGGLTRAEAFARLTAEADERVAAMRERCAAIVRATAEDGSAHAAAMMEARDMLEAIRALPVAEVPRG